MGLDRTEEASVGVDRSMRFDQALFFCNCSATNSVGLRTQKVRALKHCVIRLWDCWCCSTKGFRAWVDLGYQSNCWYFVVGHGLI